MRIETTRPDRFSKLDSHLKGYVDRGDVGHLLTAVYQNNEIVYASKFGYRDFQKTTPIEFDDIYRIYSMTKPIAATALMMLHDEGKFNLIDPIAKYLPEFKEMSVLESYDPETEEKKIVDAQSPITILHLLTHTAGLSYGFFPQVPVDAIYGEKFGFSGEFRAKNILESVQKLDPLPEFSKKLASLSVFSTSREILVWI